MATSSANPRKLRRYSEDGLDLVRALRPQATAVDQAIRALQASGSPHIPATDVHAELTDLVRSWYHLDEFAGDVADGFFRANRRGEGGRFDDTVMTVDDGALARLGRIGYADRYAAIAAARRSAAELDRLRRGRATRSDVQRFVAGIGRGQYDPAFAATFAGRVGARGFADAVAMIRTTHAGGGTVSPEGIAAVRVLSNTLTSALDTLPQVPAAERRDPDNQHLADGDRLGPELVHGLLEERFPRSGGSGQPPTTQQDLSVLMRFADPPTTIAVAVANARMTPRLRFHHQRTGDAASAWGDYGQDLANYATMLGRNPDAAARWLAGGNNIEHVVTRPGAADVDGGVALAHLVETGVTHPDQQLRHQLMSQAIDGVGRSEAIRNPHMRGALATGVERNMDLLDHRINGTGWNGHDHATHRPELTNTTIFLSEMDRDAAARARIRAATEDYVGGLGTPGVDDRSDEERIGRILGVTSRAESNADIRDHFDRRGRVEAGVGTAVDAGIGLVPGGGTTNTVVDLVTGDSIGEHGAKWFVEHAGDSPTPGENRMGEEAESADAAARAMTRLRPDTTDWRVGDSAAGNVYQELGEDPRYREYIAGGG